MRLALGMEVRGKDSELHIIEMQPRKKVKQKIRKSGRNDASQNRNLRMVNCTVAFVVFPECIAKGSRL